MKNSRRHYDADFKKMAVELVDSGKSAAEVGRDLGVSKDLVARWRREYHRDNNSSFPGNGNAILTVEQKEILQLKRELADAKMERDILKKAVSIFSKSDGKFTDL